MSIEAMKQALEALETLDAGDTYKTHNAATALRQAIEQAENPWVKTYAGGKPNYTTPVHASDKSEKYVHKSDKHRHKPVAWRYALDASVEGPRWIYIDKDPHQWLQGPATTLAVIEQLYTTPPEAQREWVGLTDEDYEELLKTRDWGVYLIEAVETKLKEKNT